MIVQFIGHRDDRAVDIVICLAISRVADPENLLVAHLELTRNSYMLTEFIFRPGTPSGAQDDEFAKPGIERLASHQRSGQAALHGGYAGILQQCPEDVE